MPLDKENILRYPRLDTILMVEEFIQENSGAFGKKKLWESLPRRMMYQTFQVVLEYLQEKKLISITPEGKIGWNCEAEEKSHGKHSWKSYM